MGRATEEEHPQRHENDAAKKDENSPAPTKIAPLDLLPSTSCCRHPGARVCSIVSTCTGCCCHVTATSTPSRADIASMPPKKDAFADLFSLAAGTSASSVNLSLNNLSLASQTPTLGQKSANLWLDLDVLTPKGTPPPQGATGGALGFNSDPFDSLFGNSEPKSGPLAPPVPVAPSPRNPTQRHDVSLLGEEFEDAFTVSEPADVTVTLNVATARISPPQTSSQGGTPRASANGTETSRNPYTAADADADEVLAGLLDIGFSVEVANDAIAHVGPDLQKAVNYVMSRGPLRTPTREKADSPRDLDFSATVQTVSDDIYRKASSLFTKSKKMVIKNISNMQRPQNTNGLPTWMQNQLQYKEGALEKGADGSVYEDYGTDDDNIDKAAIQRFMRQQREREQARRQERMEKLSLERKGDLNIGGLGRPSRAESRPVPGQRNTPPHSEIRAQTSGSNLAAPPPQPKRQNHTPVPDVDAEVDLLGIGTASSGTTASRAAAFKKSGTADELPRRRAPRTASRSTTSGPLDTFQQSDYDTFKSRGTEAFTTGNYEDALAAFERCLAALPAKHELRIVILSNLAVTLIRVGDYKRAQQICDDGISLIGKSSSDASWSINDKPITYWHVKLLSRKAETLEMLELFPASLAIYDELVRVHAVSDKKVMDARRRLQGIVAPKPTNATSGGSGKPSATKPAPLAPQPARNKAAPSKLVTEVKNRHIRERQEEQTRFQLHDQVHGKISQWSHGKEDNLRTLLTTIDTVLPARLGFPFLVNNKVGLGDLMLPKKVKIHYMKVISNIHPDKCGQLDMEAQMLCQGVFVALNKAWDLFKSTNGLS